MRLAVILPMAYMIIQSPDGMTRIVAGESSGRYVRKVSSARLKEMVFNKDMEVLLLNNAHFNHRQDLA